MVLSSKLKLGYVIGNVIYGRFVMVCLNTLVRIHPWGR